MRGAAANHQIPRGSGCAEPPDKERLDVNVTCTISGQRSEVRALPEGFKRVAQANGASFALNAKLSSAKQNGDRLFNGTGGRMVTIPSPPPPTPQPHNKGKEYSNINRRNNVDRLSGVHYNIVQGFLSLKGLSEAGMPMSRGSFLACSLQ